MKASYSSISQHRQCPQKWRYSYVEGLKRIEGDEPRVELTFGMWWHALRAGSSIDRGREAESLVSAPDELTCADYGVHRTVDTKGTEVESRVLTASQLWWQGLTDEFKEAFLDKLGGSVPDRLAYVNERWYERWAEDLQYEQPVAVELGWGRELSETDTRLVGYIDEIFWNAKRKILVARDHKTAKSLGFNSTVSDMMESQLQLYAWGATPRLRQLGIDDNIRAVAYDRVRSVAPKTPKLNLDGTLSKSIKDFDLYTYTTWVNASQEFPGRAKDGSGAGVYELDEMEVERLRGQDENWFQRTLMPLNKYVLAAHRNAAVDTAEDMARTVKRSAETGAAPRNFSTACQWCDFSDLCMAEMLNGPHDYDSGIELAAYGVTRKV